MSQARVERSTKETKIVLEIDWARNEPPQISTGVPFFDHMLTACAFHGGFFLKVAAEGDLAVDPHHLVEDTGIVLGQALRQTQTSLGATARFGHAVIPMDEALAEVTIDACGRAYWVYQAEYPQTHAGAFDLSLVREFWIGLANQAAINLHGTVRYGTNGHHMAEALFKALGKALAQAYAPRKGQILSTKGTL